MKNYRKIPILVLTDAEKTARKARATKNANLRKKDLQNEKLLRKDKALGRAKAELKAIKELIAKGWRPSN